ARMGARVSRSLGAARGPHRRRRSIRGPHLVRQRHRARLQHDPCRGSREAACGPGRRAGRHTGQHAARGQPAAAAVRRLPGGVERRRAGRASDGGKLPVPDQMSLALPVRWAGLLALAALVGGLAVTVTVVPPDVTTLRRRLTAWNRTSVALLLV